MQTRFIHSSERRITKAGLKNSASHVLPANSLVISSRAPIGYFALPTKEFCTNQGCKSIVFNEEQDPEFHYYNILFRVKALKDKGHGTTFAEISKKALAQIEMPTPDDKKVQSKIAEVLSTIDRAIAQSEALIAKHQRIKTGLMQDLLTRGIDEHGELGNSVAHPDQFTKSDFGLFPKAWKITTLGKIIADTKGLIQTGPFGTQVHAYDYVEEGIPTMMPQYVDETGWIELEDLPRLTPAKALELRRHALKENDVIFARRGELSKCSAISKREEGWICGSDFMLVRVSSSIMSGEWFAHYYRDDIGQRQVMAQAVGSIMKGINTPLMMSLVVALPSIEEQTRILAIIDSQEKIIKETIDQHKKLLKIKHGLMQDLLSGEVSVKPLLES
ncbi:MAG: restriction endonuclease subunit S [Chloroflexi bacterium]|nr:restriction endonuclease subunit S [Chloroflexota bacterium]